MTETDLLDRKQAAAFLKISDRTLDRIADLPRVRIGLRRVLYRRADLAAYVTRRIETQHAA
ncbi:MULTISPECIES: AlpA family transcriptional regulator [unclassified Acidiphilium]|uniref:helix-turn-helix transcriptional regulator n=1 Tax=unclassified Acidiphilium TaxID=2617493 RepID=UPI000587D47A|nr:MULTISPECIES: hypothetical protein [unclassified Acidiphilium]OYV54322.1 MAG: hypothetical protein B7Z76_14925 [Acidiphilium sp. 20-67-58]OYV67607.1 MAG: hypothetical protein B7X09_00955 [Acidiphilium sp. 21-66-27]HQT62588.1 hypothetical protein [Acidiphilium sp.]HQU11628.1 hypothetical protein [Acidiphilium sp.]